MNLMKDPKVIALRQKLSMSEYIQKHGDVRICPGPFPLRFRPQHYRLRDPRVKYVDEYDDSLSFASTQILFKFMSKRQKELEALPNYEELVLEQQKSIAAEKSNRKLKLVNRRKLKFREGPPFKKCKLNEVEDGLANANEDVDLSLMEVLNANQVEDGFANEMKAVDVDLSLMEVLKPCAAQNASHSKAD